MKISEMMHLLKSIGVDYSNDPKNRKLSFRTNAITPNRLCDVVVVYDEKGVIDDMLGEPILQDELDNIIKEENKNKKKNGKTQYELKAEELIDLILIECESEDGFEVSKLDWAKEAERKICEELVKQGKIELIGHDFENNYYGIKQNKFGNLE